MKKLILCFLAAMLMLSVLVAAPQVGPPTCAFVGGVCETDAELSGVCNDYDKMVYGETSDCYEPGKLCCVPETCENFGGYCDISCSSDYVQVADGKCGEEDVCCRAEGISGPDAEGNLVCSGSSMQTKYNPKALKEIFGDEEYAVVCEESGSIYLGMGDSESVFLGENLDGVVMYGTITSEQNRKMLKIENGGLSSSSSSAFEEYFQLKPTAFSITADTITISFANKTKPRISVSGDGAIKWGDVFFGCQKKDANGRAASCSLTAEMSYLESEGDRYYEAGNKMLSINYVNVNGLGFISELDALQTYLNRQPDTVDKLKEEVGDELVAMPLSNLKNIGLFKPLSESRNYPYTLSVDTAADGSSTFNYLKIKSITGNDVNINDANIDAIGNRRGMQPITEEVEISPQEADNAQTLDVTADAARVSGENQDVFSVNAQCVDARGTSRAKVNVFIGNNKLLEATQCNNVAVIPPQPAGTGIAIADTQDFTWLMLNVQDKEIKVIRDIQDYGDLSIWMLQGYENFVLENPPGTGSICDAIPNAYIITNPRNNNRLELSDELISIVPEGKLIPDLGFGFTAELCNGTVMETLACKKTGECTLDGDPVFGVTAAPMREVRGAERTGRRFEEGAKTALSELPPFGCEADSECKPTEQCVEGECLKPCADDMNCFAGMVCSGNYCRTGCRTRVDCFEGQECINGLCERQITPIPPFSEDAKAAGEAQKGFFTRAWDWVKGLFA